MVKKETLHKHVCNHNIKKNQAIYAHRLVVKYNFYTKHLAFDSKLNFLWQNLIKMYTKSINECF